MKCARYEPHKTFRPHRASGHRIYRNLNRSTLCVREHVPPTTTKPMNRNALRRHDTPDYVMKSKIVGACSTPAGAAVAADAHARISSLDCN